MTFSLFIRGTFCFFRVLGDAALKNGFLMHSEHLSGWYGPAFPNAESVLPSSVLSTFFLDREVKARNPFALFDSLVGSAFLAVLVVCTWSMTRPQSHLLIFFEHFRSRRSWVMIKQSCCVVLEGGVLILRFSSRFVMSDKVGESPTEFKW